MKISFKLLLSLFLVVASAHATESRTFHLIAGNAAPELAQAVAASLGMPLTAISVGRFNDGEISIAIQENIRNSDVYIIQPTCRSEGASVNDNLMELLLLVRTAKRASAKSITAVIPYFGYARQDRKVKPRVPISASDVSMLIEHAGVDRVLAVDLHCGQIQGFFHQVPVDNLYGSTVFIPYFAKKDLVQPVVVSPDAGGVERAKLFRDGLTKQGVKSELAIIIKQRKEAGVIETVNLVGSVAGCDVIIVDDMCDTAGTLCKAAEELKEKGARRVFACITHPVFSGPALERIASSVLTEVVVADTVPVSKDAPKNVVKVSVAPLIAEAIKRIQEGGPVSELFI